MDQLTYDHAANRRRRRRRALVTILLAASLATFGAGAMSLARFTDQEAVDGTWSTGTIILGVDAGVSFTAVDILPGDTGTKTITVENNGTGDLRYALSTSATDDGSALADQIALTVREGACPSAGTVVYTGPLGDAEWGDPAQGEQGGERDLAAGLTEDLCFAWSFPLLSGNAYQDKTTTATFTFDAEQIDNNP
jgi:hypothetical protein